MNPKVLVIMTCESKPYPQSVQSILGQDYGNFIFLLYTKTQEDLNKDFQTNKTLNIAKVRNEIRKIALASDANYFLWVDGDMVYPKHTISKFMLNMLAERSTISINCEGKAIPVGTPVPKKHIIGGWYKIKDTPDRWVAGRWVADNKIYQCTAVERGFVRMDFVGLGCAMMSRELLENIEFKDGLDKTAFNTTLLTEMPIGPCVEFGNLCYEHCYTLYMDGDIVCDHLFSFKERIRLMRERLAASFKPTLRYKYNERNEIKSIKEKYGKPA
jgi:hypothetical protein